MKKIIIVLCLVPIAVQTMEEKKNNEKQHIIEQHPEHISFPLNYEQLNQSLDEAQEIKQKFNNLLDHINSHPVLFTDLLEMHVTNQTRLYPEESEQDYLQSKILKLNSKLISLGNNARPCKQAVLTSPIKQSDDKKILTDQQLRYWEITLTQRQKIVKKMMTLQLLHHYLTLDSLSTELKMVRNKRDAYAENDTKETSEKN